MADPAWGAAPSLSDNDTASTRSAFPPTGSRSTPCYHPLPFPPPHDEMPQLTGRSTFGYPSNGTYHWKPTWTRRDATLSMLVGRNNPPSTSSDEWCIRQQCTIQEQLEQHRELQLHRLNQHRQGDVPTQLQAMDVPRWQQEQGQQMPRLVEQPRDLSCTGGVAPSEWRHGVHTLGASTPSFDRDKRQQLDARQPHGQFYNARVECSEQLPVRTTTVAIPTHSYMSDYRENARRDIVLDRNDGVFFVGQTSQIVQARVQAPNSENFAIRAVHRWGIHNVMLLAGTQPETTKVSHMQRMQRFIPQQPLHPQPYYPAEMNQCSRQVRGTLGQATGSSLDEALWYKIMEHFSTNAAPAAGKPTTTYVSAASKAVFDKAWENKAIFNAIPAESRILNRAGEQLQGETNEHLRLPIPPSKAAVVPGISLAPQAVRLLTMRDILNNEVGFSKADLSTNRSRGENPKRSPSTRKMSRKKTSAKRQKMPQQQSVRKFQEQVMNQPARAFLPSQSVSGVTVSAFAPTTGLYTPMHLAFLESRAARALKQAAGITNTRPSLAAISTPLSHSLLPTSVVQLSNKFGKKSIAAYERPIHRKMVNAPSDMCNDSATYQSIRHHTSTPFQDTARLESVMNDVQGKNLLQARAKQKANEPKMRLTGQTIVDSVSERPDKAFRQHRRHQSYFEVSAVSSKVANDVQSPMKLDVVEIEKDVIVPKKMSRAKRHRARSTPFTAGGRKQQVHGMLPSTEEPIMRTGSIAATAAASATVSRTPVVSGLPRMENRTVVIFCKRDFMRYQAAKIWRKYQEQLKKHEEWREVRVTGKRTRYLNFRYDDEIRRAQNRTFARSDRPRRKPLQKKGGNRIFEASVVTADSTSVKRVASSRVVIDNATDETTSPARNIGGVTTSADSGNADGDCS